MAKKDWDIGKGLRGTFKGLDRKFSTKRKSKKGKLANSAFFRDFDKKFK